MLEILTRIEKTDVWTYLKQTEKPIVIYGMGDGAQKIMDRCVLNRITIKEIFASDEFVRGHSFLGHRVKKFSEIEKQYDDFIILLAFAAFRPELIEKINDLARRYEVLSPDTPLFGEGTFDRTYVDTHIEELQQTYDLLADQKSKDVLIHIINFKLTGKLPYLEAATTQREEILGDIIPFGKKEVIVDLGAYDGDTITEFLGLCGGDCKKIIAVEPDKKNFKKLITFAQGKQEVDMVLHNVGVWCEETTLNFEGSGGRNSALNSKGKTQLIVKTVDGILEQEGATLIKYDVEGAELQALKGTIDTMKKYKPKLIIAAYHRNEDLFTLPMMLKGVCSDYKIYLRHHPYIPAWETNFYVI